MGGDQQTAHRFGVVKSQALTIAVVLVLLLFVFKCDSVDPSCQCVYFDGFGGQQQNGTFMSPDYAVSKYYPADVHCILYTFAGDPNEIVQLKLDHFELQNPDSNKTCRDFLRIFTDLAKPGVNEQSQWQHNLCGHLTAQQPLLFYSKGSWLILEFHSDSFQSEHDRGFIGQFLFLDKSFFTTDGFLHEGTTCDYEINSSQQQIGKLFSPFYPFPYPPDTECHYWLSGSSDQQIRLTITKLSLPYEDNSCVDAKHRLIVYDGEGTREMIQSSRWTKVPVLMEYCAKSSVPDSVISSGPKLYIVFKSGDNLPTNQGRGFECMFEFISRPSKRVVQPKLNESCDVVISSSDSKRGGILSSPNFPNAYKSDMRCSYKFVSSGSERAQIIFTEFDLCKTYSPEENVRNPNCHSTDDHIIAYVDGDVKSESELDSFCGKVTPPQLMSSRNLLKIEFVSHGFKKENCRGFQFMYKFKENFGITSGEQLRDHTCAFQFVSNKTKNGTVTSPNYPGLYPRNIDCYYTFHGNPDEKVIIQFAYFDVEGDGKCDNDSLSDYVEFSNYLYHDRKLRRYCNPRHPKRMDSEKNYYRVTFHSNNMFDGRGFSAFYQFAHESSTNALKKVKSSASEMPGIGVAVLSMSLLCQLLI